MKLSKPTRVALWTGVGVSVAFLIVWWIADHRRGMEWAISVVRDRYPDVSQISTASLGAWLEDEKEPPPVIVDTRSAEEFAVSHLPGAERLDSSASDSEITTRFRKDQPLTLYCAAGYRASEMARRLQALGFRDVSNLSGGIFQWANEGRELRRSGVRVRQVHPVRRAFARLLRPEVRMR